MDPFTFIGWALAVAASILIIGAAAAVAIALVAGAIRGKREVTR